MTTPTVSLGATVSVNSVVSNGDWSPDGGTMLAALNNTTNWIEFQYTGTSPLNFDMVSYSPTAPVRIWGVEFAMISFLADDAAICPVTIQANDGDDGILALDWQMGNYDGEGGQQFTGLLTAWDSPIAEWDLTDVNVQVGVPDSGAAKFRQFYMRVYTWTPTSYTPQLFLPSHVRLFSGEAYRTRGSIYKPAVGFDLTGDVPDVVHMVSAASTLTAPAGRTRLDDTGVVPVYPLDRGIVDSDFDIYRGGSGLVWSVQVGGRGGWYQAAKRDYTWASWKEYTPSQGIEPPLAPFMQATVNGDQVDLSGFSCDNLYQSLFYRFHIPYSGWNDALVYPLEAGSSCTTSYALVSGFYRQRVTRDSTTGLAQMIYPHVPVKPNEAYAGGLRVRPSATRTCHAKVRWYTSAGALISTSTLASSSCTAATDTDLFGSATAPATAAIAVMVFEGDSFAATNTADVHAVILRRTAAHLSDDDPACAGYLWGNASAGWGFKTATGIGDPLKFQTDAGLTLGSVAGNAFKLTTNGTASAGLYTVTLGGELGPFLPESFPEPFQISSRLTGQSNYANGFWSFGLRFLDEHYNQIGTIWHDGGSAGSGVDLTLELEGVTVPSGTVHIQSLVGVEALATSQIFTFNRLEIFCQPAFPVITSSTYDVIPGMGDYRFPLETPVAWMGIERQLPGQDYVTIAMIQIDPASDVAFSDFVVPEGLTFKYRACVYGCQNAQLVKGTYSAELEVSASPPAEQRFVLWDPSQDLGPLRFDVEGSSPQLEFTLIADMTQYSPIGRDRKVVTKDVSKGRSFRINVAQVVDASELSLWEQLHEDRNALVLMRPHTGEVWTVVLVGDVRVVIQNTTPVSYRIAAQLEEVELAPVW